MDKITAPSSLRYARRWVLHINKQPFDLYGSPKGWNRPEFWTTFDEAVKVLQKNSRYHGIGFIVAREPKRGDKQIIGGDLDCCRDPITGQGSEWALNILKRLNSSSAVSFSSCGFRFFCFGKLPEGINDVMGHGQDDLTPEMKEHILAAKPHLQDRLDKGEKVWNGFELYEDGPKHLTITGEWLSEYPNELQHRQEEIEEIIKPFKSEPEKIIIKPKKVKDPSSDRLPSLSVRDVINIHGFKREGDELVGPNPAFGSSTGANLKVNVDKDTWCNFHNEIKKGGDAWVWLACESGIIRWEDAGPGALDDPKTVTQVLKYAIKRGLVSKDVLGPKIKLKPELRKAKEEIKPNEPISREITVEDKPKIEDIHGVPENQRIRVTLCSNLAINIEECLEALYENNLPPKIFKRGGELCRIKPMGEGRFKIETITDYALRNELSIAALIEQFDKSGEEFKECKPPMDLVRGILALSSWDFPELEGMINSPVVRPDGSLLVKPGYDRTTRLYYAPEPGLKISDIPKEIDQKTSMEAAKFILDEILPDFPFIDEASKINMLAAFISPVARPMVDGCVPMLLIDKPSPGTGASKLLDLVSLVSTGRPMAALSPPSDDDEWRKLITGTMRDGTPLICLDNIASDLKADSLARALSSSIWKDRILGKPDAVEYPQKACWYATGNNLTLSGDIPRRSYLTQIDAKMERPWERKAANFRHSNINRWTIDHRGEILSKLLIMAAGWAQAGKPDGIDKIIGGFDEWVTVIGGILKFCGYDQFLGNLNKLYEDIDMGNDEWADFFSYWRAIHGDQDLSSSELLSEFLNKDGGFRKHIPSEMAEKIKYNAPGDSKKVGVLLKKKLHVRYNTNDKTLMLDQKVDKHTKAKTWMVIYATNETIT